MNNPETSNEIKMDASSLYREEVFTDNAIRPSTWDFDFDNSRLVRYICESSLQR